MNIYETFNNLRYHHENEVVEFKKAENNFDFEDLGSSQQCQVRRRISKKKIEVKKVIKII